MLQSLLKSSTGTGMIENASYNKGNPYFVSFKPLLHEHARLSDKELENYNKYNDVIDDLDDQITQLEEEKLDVFDLRLEAKMALDKVKSGSFNMVDIYLEGLKPRLADQWKKLGKTPKQRKAKLVSESELREEFLKAQAARKAYEKKNPGAAATTSGEKVKPFTFKNGMMVIKLNEVLDALEAMDDETFNAHLKDGKNELADWMQTVKKNVADEIRKVKTRQETIKILQDNMPKS